jgi:hypothetical protein
MSLWNDYESKTINSPMRLSIIFCVLLLASACQQKETFTGYHIDKSTVADSAIVSTAHPLASEVGLQVLKDGGNAIDAAVAQNRADISDSRKVNPLSSDFVFRR